MTILILAVKCIYSKSLMKYGSALGIFFAKIFTPGKKFQTNFYIFRGTQLRDLESIKKDLLTDLNFKQHQATYLPETNRVHTGFDASYMSVRLVSV